MYTCKPDIVDTDVVSMDTYNKSFMTNTDKIIHRIRMLFKERFFYKKMDLISHINVVKQYPLDQINASLNQLVEDKSEIVKDKYGREGHIVNVDMMYLFQPIELTYKNISVYDRSTPIDYKRETLHINLSDKINENVYKPPVNKKGFRIVEMDASKTAPVVSKASSVQASSVQASSVQASSVKDLSVESKEGEPIEDKPKTKQKTTISESLNFIYNKYKIATSFKEVANKESIIKEHKQDNLWYYICNEVIIFMSNKDVLELFGINKDTLISYVVSHIVNEISFDDKIELLNYVFNDKTYTEMKTNKDIFLSRVKNVFDRNVIEKDGVKYMLLLHSSEFISKKMNVDENKSFKERIEEIGLRLVAFKDGQWIQCKYTEYEKVKDKIKMFSRDESNKYLNEIVGFLTFFKNDNYLVFKTKIITDKHSKGSRCDQKTKDKIKSILYEKIIEKVDKYKKFFIENKDENNMSIEQKHSFIFNNKTAICVMQELFMCIYNDKKIGGKFWLLDPVQCVLYDVENI